jgi:hypothetical protein
MDDSCFGAVTSMCYTMPDAVSSNLEISPAVGISIGHSLPKPDAIGVFTISTQIAFKRISDPYVRYAIDLERMTTPASR